MVLRQLARTIVRDFWLSGSWGGKETRPVAEGQTQFLKYDLLFSALKVRLVDNTLLNDISERAFLRGVAEPARASQLASTVWSKNVKLAKYK